MEQREVLLWLLDHDSRDNLTLALDESAPYKCLPEMTGRELDAALQQALHDGHALGDRKDYAGSIRLWTRTRLTAKALRDLGEWPPAGGEYRAGPWDDRRWGRVSKPLLAELAERPPHGGVVSKPVGGGDPDGWQRWMDLLRLREAGLIHGKEVGMGLQDIVVTRQGKAALDPPGDDPLIRARNDLDRGAKADAVTAAIDEALKPVLQNLANVHNVSRTKDNGKDLHLAGINDGLAKAGAYDESHRAEVYSWIAVRNIIDHGGGATVRDRRVERLIEGVEGFIEEMSPP
jgi:hypothetical protein